MLILLLLLTPILCICLSFYIFTLVEYITSGTMDTVVLLLTIMLSLILSFIDLKLLINSNKKDIYLLNMDNKINTIHGYFSFILLFIFGVSLLIRSFINNTNIYDFILGMLLIILFIYVTYEYIFSSKTDVFEIEDIEEYDDNISLIYLSLNDLILEYFVLNKDGYKKNGKYEVIYKPNLKYIKKIKGEVKDEK